MEILNRNCLTNHSYVYQWSKTFFSDLNLVEFLKHYHDLLIHPEQLKDLSVPQSSTSLRIDAKIKLHSAFSDLISRSLGTELCAKSIIMAFEMLQNETLNKHLIFTQLDRVVDLVKQNL